MASQYALYIAIPVCLAIGLIYFRKRLAEYWGYIAGIVLMSVLALSMPYILNSASSFAQALVLIIASVLAGFLASLLLAVASSSINKAIRKKRNIPYSLKSKGAVYEHDADDYNYDDSEEDGSDEEEWYAEEYDDEEQVPQYGEPEFVYWVDNDDEAAEEIRETMTESSDEPSYSEPEDFQSDYIAESEVEEANEPLQTTDAAEASEKFTTEPEYSETETQYEEPPYIEPEIEEPKDNEEELEVLPDVQVKMLSMDELYALGGELNDEELEETDKSEKNRTAMLSGMYHEAVLLKRAHEYRSAAEAFYELQRLAEDQPITRKLADFERLEALWLGEMREDAADAVFEILSRGYDLDDEERDWLKGLIALLDN